jgi:protein involved in polysaccharide export with SLBB domain
VLEDPRWNLRLRPDDVVVVHLPEQASVVGEITIPGPLTLPPTGSIPVREAVMRGGGVTEKALLAGATILRGWGGRVEQVDLNAVLYGGARAPKPLGPGDTLSIPAGKPTSVYVFGMVENPGQQRFAGRVSITAAVSHAQPKQFGALLDEAKLVRGWPHRPEVVAIDLDKLLLEHDATLDVELRDGDVVYIPESTVSDVLDFLDRALSPFAGVIQASSTSVR